MSFRFEGRRQKKSARKTSVNVVDNLLGGGASVDGPNLILGTIGGGKTLLATMVAAEGASRANVAGVKNQKWLYLTTSQRPAEIEKLAVSYLSRTSRQFAPSDLFNEVAHRKVVQGAREVPPALRWHAAMASIAMGLDIIELEMCGTKNADFADQLIRMVERHCVCNHLGGLGGIVLDDLYIAFSRHFRSRPGNINQKLFSGGICRAISAIASHVRQSLGCPLWMVYPLSEGRIGGNPQFPATHSHALDCRNLGNVISTAIVLGQKTTRSSLGQNATGPSKLLARCTKSSFPARKCEPVMLEFTSDYASLEMTDLYQMDHVGNVTLKSLDQNQPIMDETARIELMRYLDTTDNLEECVATSEVRTSKRAKRQRESKC
jgi:RecA/RadA recombinase